jgi:hypothetical protein
MYPRDVPPVTKLTYPLFVTVPPSIRTSFPLVVPSFTTFPTTWIDDVVIVEADTRELTASVEKVPGTLLLILDTNRVDRVRKDVLILDITSVDPKRVEPVSVETAMLLPIIVEYTAVGAVICVVSERVLPVRVDNAR